MSDVTEVEKLLLEVGEQLNRTPEQMRPIINKLVKENWLETLDSLRVLSNDEWHRLNIPLRLVDEIKKKLFLQNENKYVCPVSHHSSFSDTSSVHLCSSNKAVSSLSCHPNAALNLAVQLSDGKKNVSNCDASDIANPPATPPPSQFSPPSSPSQSYAGDLGSSHSSCLANNNNCIPLSKKIINQEEETDENFVNYGVPNDEKFSMPILTATENLQLTIPADHLGEVLTTLLKLIDGVLENPKEKSKRKIRKGNENFHRKVGQFANAVNVLLAAGFKDKGETLELPTAYISRLTDCHHALCELCNLIGIESPLLPQTSFNPYQPSITGTSTSVKVMSKLAAEQRFVEMKKVQQAIKERDDLIRSGGGTQNVPLNPKVFTTSKMNKIEDAIYEMKNARCEEVENDTSLSLCDMSRIKEIMSEQTPQFKSRAKIELEKLNRKKIFKECVLRITFPDKLVLQLNFKPSDKIMYVIQKLKEFLSNDIRDSRWYICETPPIRRLDSNKTLYDEGLVPGAVLHFKFEGGTEASPPYLIESLLQNVNASTPLKTSSATSYSS